MKKRQLSQIIKNYQIFRTSNSFFRTINFLIFYFSRGRSGFHFVRLHFVNSVWNNADKRKSISVETWMFLEDMSNNLSVYWVKSLWFVRWTHIVMKFSIPRRFTPFFLYWLIHPFHQYLKELRLSVMSNSTNLLCHRLSQSSQSHF